MIPSWVRKLNRELFVRTGASDFRLQLRLAAATVHDFSHCLTEFSITHSLLPHERHLFSCHLTGHATSRERRRTIRLGGTLRHRNAPDPGFKPLTTDVPRVEKITRKNNLIVAWSQEYCFAEIQTARRYSNAGMTVSTGTGPKRLEHCFSRRKPDDHAFRTRTTYSECSIDRITGIYVISRYFVIEQAPLA